MQCLNKKVMILKGEAVKREKDDKICESNDIEDDYVPPLIDTLLVVQETMKTHVQANPWERSNTHTHVHVHVHAHAHAYTHIWFLRILVSKLGLQII